MTSAAANFPAQWDRAVSYGDGVFETVLVLGGVAHLWRYHRERLVLSLKRLSIHCDIEELETSFFALAMACTDAIIKLTVARSGGTRGYDSRNARDAVVRLQHFPLPHYSRSKLSSGINLHLCRQRLSHNPALAGIKHLNRLEQVLAASEWQRDWADEGLLLDCSGAVIEGTFSNIFLVQHDTLLTPRLDDCGVAGVMRSAILNDFASEIGMSASETRITMSHLLSADAVFVCNSVFGIWAVRQLGVSFLNTQHSCLERLWALLDSYGYTRLYD